MRCEAHGSRLVCAVSLLVFWGLVSGCTSTIITPQMVQPAPQHYQTLAVGEIWAADPLWEGRLPFLRRGLTERLREKGAFVEILDPAPDILPPQTVLVTGQVTEVQKGNKALRLLIGFGAGAASASGVFELSDDDGTTLARFASSKAYAGGAGIGGFDLVDIDDLMQQLGKETADTIMRWTKGESLVPPGQNP